MKWLIGAAEGLWRSTIMQNPPGECMRVRLAGCWRQVTGFLVDSCSRRAPLRQEKGNRAIASPFTDS